MIRSYFKIIAMTTVSASYCEHHGERIRCLLCPRGCCVSEGQNGYCKVRGVRDGQLKALGYGRISSSHLDPIEKKPLSEFHPGSMIYSIGGWGCNLGCTFCQNWSISQEFKETPMHAPEEIVDCALRADSVGIAYTYNEPLISYEFVRDCADLAASKGLLNVLVTNGYINSDPAHEILPRIDALNIDIKSMDPEFYRNYCNGDLQPVLDFTLLAVELGCHVEITNLIIPGLNDTDELIISLCSWIRESLGPHVPLHLSAYHPEYKMSTARTSAETMVRARRLAEQRLNSVYIGNILI